MTRPKLTVGIPTQGKRPERLQQAIESALAQQIPALILVSDQGGGASEAVRPFLDNPLVIHRESPADSLWGNWSFALDSCETEYFAWLQDDDVIFANFVKRVLLSLDTFADASAWIARLGVSYMPGMSNWWQATGPMIPMDLRRGLPSRLAPSMIVAGGYFTSWALSPAVAFRATDAAKNLMRSMPRDADLYAERIVLARLSTLGCIACDPAYVGEWVHHGANESGRQNLAGGAAKQYPTLVRELDQLIGDAADWEAGLSDWARIVGRENCRAWLAETDGRDDLSPRLAQARAILRGAHPE